MDYFDCLWNSRILVSVTSKHPDWILNTVGPGDKIPYEQQVKRHKFEDSVICEESIDRVRKNGGSIILCS